MLRSRVLAGSMLAMLVLPAAVLADDGAGHGVSVGVLGGLNGLGVELGYRFNERFGLHGETGNYSYDQSADNSDFDIDGKIKLNSIGVLGDFYPFGGSFRISAGLRSNHNKFEGVATPASGTVKVGDDTYTAAQVGTLTGDAKFKKASPTVTLGWAGKYKTGLEFGFDLGVVAQGSPKLNVTSNGTYANNATFQQDLDQKVAEWQDDVKDYKLWPVIQLHLLYRF
ncbi:MAG TPA: hypothetical protein VMH77_08830 [Steroidobacteraceae bacterium]|nr:hypothetical protein [Steroidobacteraceae bacterium]